MGFPDMEQERPVCVEFFALDLLELNNERDILLVVYDDIILLPVVAFKDCNACLFEEVGVS